MAEDRQRQRAAFFGAVATQAASTKEPAYAERLQKNLLSVLQDASDPDYMAYERLRDRLGWVGVSAKYKEPLADMSLEACLEVLDNAELDPASRRTAVYLIYQIASAYYDSAPELTEKAVTGLIKHEKVPDGDLGELAGRLAHELREESVLTPSERVRRAPTLPAGLAL